MKRAKSHSNAKSLESSNRDQARRKEDRYHLIAEIAATRRSCDTLIDNAFRSNWDDR